MTTMKLEGILDLDWEAIWVGDDNLTERVRKTVFNGPVTVAFAGKRFTGYEIGSYEGYSSYSEWTPGDACSLELYLNNGGEHDLKRELREYDGEEITIWIADEPVNILEG